jgi:NAD(P)-dependent dehydrogenase (short-subunit alcohol dehydrogenase family)
VSPVAAGRFGGQVAVVTGGSSGIGRATVQRLLDEGASVVFGDVDEAGSEQVLRSATDQGRSGRLAFVRADVLVEDDIVGLVEAALARFGDLHCVVSNAGHGCAVEQVTELAAADWDQAFALLARAPFLGAKHGAAAMRRLGHGGAVISTASIAGLVGGAGPLAYSAAKGAVVNLCRAAAVELAPYRIRVNAVAPGLVLTPLTAYRGTDPSGLVEIGRLMDTVQPLPDHGTAEDAAAAIAFLASDDARFVTGQTLVVDGGSTIYNAVADTVTAYLAGAGDVSSATA